MRFSLRTLLAVTFIVAYISVLVQALYVYPRLVPYALLATSGAVFILWLWSLITRRD